MVELLAILGLALPISILHLALAFTNLLKVLSPILSLTFLLIFSIPFPPILSLTFYLIFSLTFPSIYLVYSPIFPLAYSLIFYLIYVLLVSSKAMLI